MGLLALWPGCYASLYLPALAFNHIIFHLFQGFIMSTLKPPPKVSVEARVLENIRSNFSECLCTISDLRFPKKDFVVQFFTFMLEELRISTAKIKQVSFAFF